VRLENAEVTLTFLEKCLFTVESSLKDLQAKVYRPAMQWPNYQHTYYPTTPTTYSHFDVGIPLPSSTVPSSASFSPLRPPITVSPILAAPQTVSSVMSIQPAPLTVPSQVPSVSSIQPAQHLVQPQLFSSLQHSHPIQQAPVHHHRIQQAQAHLQNL